MQRFTTAQRRARLVVRHGLAPAHRFASVEQAAAALVGLHATDPATIGLSAWARVDGYDHGDLDRALYDDRTLVKHMAMRRTLFVVPRDALADVQAGASERVAAQERKRLIRDVERHGVYADGAAWLRGAEADVLAALAGGRTATATELRNELPALAGSVPYGAGKTWGGDVPNGPRVLTALSAAGQLVRAGNDAAWTSSRPRWARMDEWLGAPVPHVSTGDGTRALVAAWLRAFGPGTAADLKWWLGGTLTAVRRALAELEAVEVQFDDGTTGWLLPDDTTPEPETEPAAALLPALDPTLMGWYERDWYLGPHRGALFDRNGNGGPTAWWDGRVVGSWRIVDGGVELQLLEPLAADARRALDREVQRLAAALDGHRVTWRFPSPLSKA